MLTLSICRTPILWKAVSAVYVTFVLIAAFIAAYGWEFSGSDPGLVMLAGALVPYNLTHDVATGVPVWLTPLSSVALHGGLVHLLSNMLVLLAVGPAVECLCGPGRYLGFFLLCGIVGGLAQVALDPESHLPVIGASGAISGLLGAYAVCFPLKNSIFGVPTVVPIIVWAVAQCFMSGIIASPFGGMNEVPTAYAAHVGGFFCGLITIGLFAPGETKGKLSP